MNSAYFLSSFDPNDLNMWSGIPNYMISGFEQCGVGMEKLGPLSPAPLALRTLCRARSFTYNHILNRAFGGYHIGHETGTLKHYARESSRKIAASGKGQAIITTNAPLLAFLDTDLPTLVWTDATFHGLTATYSGYRERCNAWVQETVYAERVGLSRASLIVYASEWAAESAMREYGIPEDRIRIAPLGANLLEAPSETRVRTSIRCKPAERIRLLFIGIDFERKGGRLAVETVRLLNERGLPSELVVMGPTTLSEDLQFPFVHLKGFVDKNTQAGREEFAELMFGSHWLFLPTRAECYGCVFCEASAHGVPSLATRVGGVSSAVRDGRNGRLLPPSATAADYAEMIEQYWMQPAAYRDLCKSSLAEYQQHLDWRQTCGRVIEEFRGMPAARPRSRDDAATPIHVKDSKVALG
jgi:glycosyltransferase involved in cell wall biosynthesis